MGKFFQRIPNCRQQKHQNRKALCSPSQIIKNLQYFKTWRHAICYSGTKVSRKLNTSKSHVQKFRPNNYTEGTIWDALDLTGSGRGSAAIREKTIWILLAWKAANFLLKKTMDFWGRKILHEIRVLESIYLMLLKQQSNLHKTLTWTIIGNNQSMKNKFSFTICNQPLV